MIKFFFVKNYHLLKFFRLKDTVQNVIQERIETFFLDFIQSILPFYFSHENVKKKAKYLSQTNKKNINNL